MPIQKNAEWGRHNDVTLLTFGTGDIGVSHGRLVGNDSVVLLQFAQDIPKPISEWSPEDDNIERSSDEYENLVVFVFDKIESIDVVIGKLNDVREKLLKKGTIMK